MNPNNMKRYAEGTGVSLAKKEVYQGYQKMIQAVQNCDDEKIIRYIANSIGASYISKQITSEQMRQLFHHVKLQHGL